MGRHVPDPGWGSLRDILVHTLDTEYGWRSILQAPDEDHVLEADGFADAAALKARWDVERAAWIMLNDAAHHRWWQIFEVVFGIPFLGAVALQAIAPVSFPGFLRQALLPGGAAFIIVGATFVVLARRELAQHGQPTDPKLPTSRLVTTGVFSVSRNPLYLGGGCVLAGIALALDLPWVLALLVPAVIACRYVLIAPEERYLAEKFGDQYREYAGAVHRWIGRVRRATR